MIDNREILDWLLNQGIDINCNTGQDFHLYTNEGPLWDNTCAVLNKAAALGDVEPFDHLVSRGADPSRSVALHMATRCEDPAKTVAMITHLIEQYHFDVNNNDDTCNGLWNKGLGGGLGEGVPLNGALVWDNLAAVEVLLKYGADTCDRHVLLVAIVAQARYNSNTTPVIKLCSKLALMLPMA